MRRKCKRCNSSYRPCLIGPNGRTIDRNLNNMSNEEPMRIAWYCPNCTRPLEICISEIERHLSTRVGSMMSNSLRKQKLQEGFTPGVYF